MKISAEDFGYLMEFQGKLFNICFDYNLIETKFYREDIDNIVYVTSKIINNNYDFEISLADYHKLSSLQTAILDLDIIEELFYHSSFKDDIVKFHVFLCGLSLLFSEE